MSFTPQFLYDILSKRDGGDEIDSIETVSEGPGVGDHQNFLSQVFRITAQMLMKNHKKETIKLIIKKGDLEKKSNGWTTDKSFFESESKAYLFLEKVFEFAASKNSKTERFWPDYIYSSIDTNPFLIVLQDMNEIGYKVWPKGRNVLDKDHIFLVLECLGKCHAMSRLYIIDEKPDRNTFSDPKLEYLTDYFKGGLNKVADAVKIYNAEWSYIADYIHEISDSVIDRIFECYRSVKNDFPVLVFGDLWAANILFKYSESDTSKPINARFIDFQFANINSFMIDLLHILYIALSPKFRLDNLNDLITCYQRSFVKTLTELGGDPSLAPSCEQILIVMDKMLFSEFVYSSVCSVELIAATDDDYARTKDNDVTGSHCSLQWYLTEPEKNGYIDNIRYFESKGLFNKK